MGPVVFEEGSDGGEIALDRLRYWLLLPQAPNGGGSGIVAFKGCPWAGTCNVALNAVAVQ
jgi:hypothetical protein